MRRSHFTEAMPYQPGTTRRTGPPCSRGSGSPFSKGILSQSLLAAAIEPNDAFDVARDIDRDLVSRGAREVDRRELRGLAYEALSRRKGAEAARRYLVWRKYQDPDRPVIILLGGAAGVGKTSLALEVAHRLGIGRVLSTDSIRQIMRLMFSPDLMPEIHCSTYDAYKALGLGPEGSPEAVIAGFREQVQKIAGGVNALLDRAVEENTSMLIEGVNQLPSLLDLDRYREHAHVISITVATLDADAYRDRFHARADEARERSADRYLEHFEEIGLIQDFILGEAEQFGLPIIDNVRFDDAVLSATRSVLATLKKSMPAPADSEAK